MKKLLSKLLCLLLALTVCLSFVACGDEEDGDSEGAGNEIIVPNGKVVDSAILTLNKLGVANDAIDSSKQLMLAENGTSNYQIVIPTEYTRGEDYASSDLQRFVKESLGVTLKIITDDEVGSTDNKQYLISIGKTSLLEELSKTDATLVPKYEELKENGQLIAIRGNLIFITGANNSGTYSAMVSFIEKELNFEQYALDEYNIDKLDKQVVYNFGTFKYTPNVQFNLISGGVVMRSTSQERFRQRLIADNRSGGMDVEGQGLLGGLYSHTIGSLILPKSQGAYYPDGTHLCLTNTDAFDALADDLIKRYVRILNLDDDSVTYELGMPDDFGKCTCSECTAYYKTHIDSEAYLNMLNHVAERVDAYREQVGMKTKVWIMGLCYNLYEKPPTKYNEITEEYELLHDDVYVHESVQIRFTPIGSCQGHAWNDPRCENNSNSTVHYANGWASLTPNMSLWTYGYIFHGIGGALVFPDTQAICDLADYFNEVPYHITRIQSSMTELDRPFSELKDYIRGKMYYDNEYNFDILYNEFFANYYKVAAPAMERYLNITFANFDAISDKKGYNGCIDSWFNTWMYDDMNDWPFELLIALDDCIQEAYDLIENSNLDAETKAKLVDRVESDSLMHRTFLVGRFEVNYPASEYQKLKAEFIADCAKHGFINRAGA